MEWTEKERQEYYNKLMNYANHARSYAKYSGITIKRIAPNYCEGELTVTADSCNYLGIVHGGCLATLADTVAGIAACSSGRGTVTLSYGFNFIRPARGNVIKCIAEPDKVGRTISVFRCSLTDDAGELVASGQFTFFMTGPLELKELHEDDTK